MDTLIALKSSGFYLLKKCGSKVNFIYSINRQDASRRSSSYT